MFETGDTASYTYTPGTSPLRVRLTWQWAGLTRISGRYDLATEATVISGDAVAANGTTIVSAAFPEDGTGLSVTGDFRAQGNLTFELFPPTR